MPAKANKPTVSTVEALFEPQEGETTPLPRYRANHNLVFGDLIVEFFPDQLLKPFAREGEITTLYWPLRRYPDRVQLLIVLGAITPVVEE